MNPFHPWLTPAGGVRSLNGHFVKNNLVHHLPLAVNPHRVLSQLIDFILLIQYNSY